LAGECLILYQVEEVVSYRVKKLEEEESHCLQNLLVLGTLFVLTAGAEEKDRYGYNQGNCFRDVNNGLPFIDVNDEIRNDAGRHL
jgi:hypothetical protein